MIVDVIRYVPFLRIVYPVFKLFETNTFVGVSVDFIEKVSTNTF